MPLSDRLSPERIPCAIMRARLYRDIRRTTPRVSADSWKEHTVAPSERLMPETIALRVYRNHKLKWVVLAAAGLDDYRQPLESGEVLRLPTVEWLRDRMRVYERMADIDVTPPPVLARAHLAGETPHLTPPSDAEARAILSDALAALEKPAPLVSSTDAVDEESLNRQRDDFERKMQAIRKALAMLEVES